MIDEKRAFRGAHNVILEDRNKLTLSGVSDVDSFDEQTVVLFTDLGELTVTGSDLHIGKLSIETGDVSITGEIHAIAYADERRSKSSGVFSRLFK